MWTVETLKRIAKDRGEELPQNVLLEQALLAHERFRGRAERSFAKHHAKRQMDQLLDRLESFPEARVGEFAPLKQLRAYAAERERAREGEKAKARDEERVNPLIPAMAKMDAEDMEEEDGLSR